jgi:hypothetical protein
MQKVIVKAGDHGLRNGFHHGEPFYGLLAFKHRGKKRIKKAQRRTGIHLASIAHDITDCLQCSLSASATDPSNRFHPSIYPSVRPASSPTHNYKQVPCITFLTVTS